MIESVDAMAVLAHHDEDLITRPVRIRHRILVVDDRPENLIAVEAALAPLGALVVTAQLGRRGARRLLEQDFSLVLLDVPMPGMDGFETARWIRARARTAARPDHLRHRARRTSRRTSCARYELGAVDFLFKPFAPEILRAKADGVRRAAGAHRGARRPSASTSSSRERAAHERELPSSQRETAAKHRARAALNEAARRDRSPQGRVPRDPRARAAQPARAAADRCSISSSTTPDKPLTPSA